MATIKPLEGRTVHQIQSGQVIVDLCSVAKELVENSLDASATSIEVRFKNHGLDSIEVQDNGVGISKENYESIALKHFTSKLSSYDELTSLKTFGFRGEALSSLCALSQFHILTAQADEAPKGIRLDFEISGKLKSTQVAPCPKGTTVAVESLFMNLPVRRRELEKKVKREYAKVLAVLQAYACISTDTKFSVSNVLAKSKKVMVFATRSNPTTRENIANVYGAKALANLDPTRKVVQSEWEAIGQVGDCLWLIKKNVHVHGHVSRPIFGEGRQAPDRQMFFVNSRPCALPQVAKVFNEVYKSYNISQSPFVFANIILDTNAYDVNVSPDKRTVLLHDQTVLLESLKQSLIDLFERQDQTVPHSQYRTENLTSFKPLNIYRDLTAEGPESGTRESLFDASEEDSDTEDANSDTLEVDEKATGLIEKFVGRKSRGRGQMTGTNSESGKSANVKSQDKQKLANMLGISRDGFFQRPVLLDGDAQKGIESEFMLGDKHDPNRGDDQTIAAEQVSAEEERTHIEAGQTHINQLNDFKPASSVVQNAFDRMRPRRITAEVATITIGSKTTTAIIGHSPSKRRRISTPASDLSSSEVKRDDSSKQVFGSSLRIFAAPGTQSMLTSRESSGSHLPPVDHEDDDSSTSSRSNEIERLEIIEETRREAAAGADDDLEGRVSVEDPSDELSSGSEYLDEQRKKLKEDFKVAELIAQAEDKLATPSEDSTKRAKRLLRRSGNKDATTQLNQIIRSSIDRIDRQIQHLEALVRQSPPDHYRSEPAAFTEDASAEAQLSLTVRKEDFLRMHIVGQFNLGFILAFRPGKATTSDPTITALDDELFIIDQHASDEKFNFERLQSSSVVQNQPLVKPYLLDLTAIEEEIIIENNDILLKNGFVVTIDTSGDEPVGQRCKLHSLPMSREVTFNTTDLEELIALLADSPSLPLTTSGHFFPRENKGVNNSIPRPSKVRRMFAMRACRSSVMIGKSLTKAQMAKLVRHMGEIDKPWNCPHGRPTMRHVLGLRNWEGWREGMGSEGPGLRSQDEVDWKGWSERMKNIQGSDSDRHRDENIDAGEDEGEKRDETESDSTEGEEDGKEGAEEDGEEDEEEDEEDGEEDEEDGEEDGEDGEEDED